MLKQNKGITLVLLVVLVIIMVLVAGVSTYTGLGLAKEASKTAFLQELRIVQAGTDVIYEKLKSENLNYPDYLSDLNELTQEDLQIIESHSSSLVNDFRKFQGVSDFIRINIDGINNTYYINFKTAEVIKKIPFNYEDKDYYTLSQFGEVKTNNINTFINSEVIKENNIYKIKVTIDYPFNAQNKNYSTNPTGNTATYTGSFYVDNNSSITTSFTLLDNTITNAKNIYYKNFTQRGIHNNPKLAKGMTPVKYVNDSWYVTEPNDIGWYDYNLNKYAYVMLQDNFTYDESTGKVLTPGSLFLWVPRYLDNYYTNRNK